MSVLEDCMREDLNARAQRRIAVLDPVKLVIDNYPAGPERGVLRAEPSAAAGAGPGARCRSTRELWIERDDYTEAPPKGYFRLSPGAEVRLRYGYIVRCIGADKDADGNVAAVHCTYDPATRSGTPGADARKVKGNIHWLSSAHAVAGGGAPLRPAVRRAVSRRAQSLGARGDGDAGRARHRRTRMVVAGDEATTRRRPSPSSATISTTSIPTPSG